MTNSSLTSLDLRGTMGENMYSFKLSGALLVNTTLIHLDVSSNNISDSDVSGLLSALKTNMTLTSLNIKKNNLGLKSCQALCDVIRTNTTLTQLKVGELDDEADFDYDQSIRDIQNALVHNGTLLRFELKDEFIQTEALIDRNRNNYVRRTQSLTHNLLTQHLMWDPTTGSETMS